MARRNRTQSNQQYERPEPKPDGPRLFVAASLPAGVTDQLGQLLDDLSSRELPVRWTAPNALHVTMQFIGEVPTERAELVRMSFANLTPKSGPIKLRTGKLGVFPNERRPRILWIGLEGQTDRLNGLYGEIGILLDRLGIEREQTSFKPHLTLGRARDSVDQLFSYQLAETFKSNSIQEIVSHPVDFTISDVTLFRSYLEKSGARYEPLATVKL